MERYSEIEGFSARATATPESSATSSRDTIEIPPGHIPRHHHGPSELGRPVKSVTSANSAASYVAGNVTVPDYQGSGALGYAAHLSNVPTSGYATEPTRYTSHLPPASAVSAYEPRSYTFHPGGYPLQPRQELNYGHLSQSYVSQSQQPSLRTDSETYNAALALVQSQNKMFSDDSGGQFYQLDSGAANNSSYEVVHTHLVSNSSQNVSIGPDQDRSDKVVYVPEKPQTLINEDSETVGIREDTIPSTVDNSSGHIEVVVETIELADAPTKSGTLREDTLVLLKADSSAEQRLSHLTNSVLEETSKSVSTEETPLDKQTGENQEDLTSTSDKVDKTYIDTASQVEGPELESRFGVLAEEFKEFQGSKGCCIKLKPVKKSYLDGSCNNIVFDIEIDNELFVSSIEKTYLTEKTSSYSFKISSHKDYYPKPTSPNIQNDGVSATVKPTETAPGFELLTENPTFELIKESKQPKIKAEKEEVAPDKVMTRASKRKMTKPLKKTALKQLSKSGNTVEVKISSKHDKTSKSSKKEKGSESSKKEKESKSLKKEQESKKKRSKCKSKSSKGYESAAIDIEEAADKSDDYNSAAENTVVGENDDGTIDVTDAGRKDIVIEVKSETSDEIKTNEQINDDGEKVIFKQKRKRKVETDDESRPKRKYNKRMEFSQTELNYSVRKSETGKRIYTCPHCNRDFNQVGNVTEHMRTHTGEKPFSCTICNKGHTVYVCLTCGRENKIFVNFLRHRRTHTGEKPYQCEICSKCFSCQSGLNEHKLTHRPDRNYPCLECQFAFKTYNSLRKHIRRVHQRERNSTCHLCGESFPCNYELNTHLLRHTGDRPFSCETCGKSFQRRSALVRHKDIHAGTVRYQCHLCGLGFNRGDSYETHLKKSHGEEDVAFYRANKNLFREEGHAYFASHGTDGAAASFHIQNLAKPSISKRKPMSTTHTVDKEEEMQAVESVLIDEQSVEIEATELGMEDYVIHTAQLEELGDNKIDIGEEFVTVKVVGKSGNPQIMICPVKRS